MKRRRWIVLTLWLGAAACSHKDAPASPGVEAVSASKPADLAEVVDGGAALASRPANSVAPAATDAGVASAKTATPPPMTPQVRQLMERTQRALHGTRMPGLMPHGSLERGTLIYRGPPPPPLSSQPPTPQKQ